MVSATPTDLCVLSSLNCNSFSCCRATLVEGRKGQMIDDLPALETCQSGALVIFSSKVNSHVTRESTR